MGELIDKWKGKIKETIGRATGDRSLVAKGHVDEARGKVKGGFEETKRAIRDAANPDRSNPTRL